MDESRSTEDKARDGGRKPAEVMAFLGVEPGMTVIDVIAASGYYTEVLSRTVGPRGKVYAQNPAAVLKFSDGANDKALATRLADNRLPNVIRWDRETTDLGIAPNSIDFAMTALNFHDVYNGSGKDAAVSFAKLVFDVLKPGAVFGVIDHEGAAAADNQSLHRMQGGLALEALLEAGFSIESTSNTLRNPEDDLSKMVFDPSIRGKTDRFLIKARKPK
jgi:predicted methyltransferase